ncbi:MAG: putative lipoprotein [Flavobacteriales bacterium]|jgi:predicted lipoprotein
MRLYSIFLVLVVAIGFSSCGDKLNSTNSPFSNFDFEKWSANYSTVGADRIASIKDGIVKIKSIANSQNGTWSLSVLDSLKNEFNTTYLIYQEAESFQIGIAENLAMRSKLNTFPTDTVSVEGFVESENYNFDAVSHFASQGLPALDYLLFAGSSAEILNRLNTESKYEAYLLALTSELNLFLAQIEGVEWLGSYASNSAFAANGPVSDVVNNFVFTFELCARARVGIPLGKFSADIPLPEKVEGKFSKQSHALLYKNLQNLHQMYLGYEQAGNGSGLEELVLEVPSGSDLDNKIQTQFETVLDLASDLQSPIDVLVDSAPEQLEALYLEMKKLVVLIKVDMPSRLGVLITYNDNDGD